ncbi:MAG: hypothetical protein IPG34_10980 [Rhodocyclaceae bacterium]|nr:hypothetical protein [Rhodocyclaceae bacterium]
MTTSTRRRRQRQLSGRGGDDRLEGRRGDDAAGEFATVFCGQFGVALPGGQRLCKAAGGYALQIAQPRRWEERGFYQAHIAVPPASPCEFLLRRRVFDARRPRRARRGMAGFVQAGNISLRRPGSGVRGEREWGAILKAKADPCESRRWRDGDGEFAKHRIAPSAGCATYASRTRLLHCDRTLDVANAARWRARHEPRPAYPMLIAAVLLNGCTATAQQRPESASARLATAEAMFAERCKKAGVFIHRTAENVEGIFLLKVRPENEDPDFNDQFRLNDPCGRDLTGRCRHTELSRPVLLQRPMQETTLPCSAQCLSI